MSDLVEPPTSDLWTIPGEENLLPAFQAQDRANFGGAEHYHALQVQDFLRAILENREPSVTGEDGRRVVALIAAIYESSRTGQGIKLSSGRSPYRRSP